MQTTFVKGVTKCYQRNSMWVGDKLLLSLTVEISCGLILQRKRSCIL